MQIPDHTPTLRSERVLIRPFQSEDALGRARCGKDPDIIRMFGGSPPFTEPVAMQAEEAEAWLQHVSTDGNPLHWALEVEGTFVGTARLHSADEFDQRAQYAIGILDRQRLGIGLGAEVTQTIARYGFAEVGLHRIGLRVLAFNTRAIACYTKCGFVEEGRERESVLVGDDWHDDVIMGLLAREAS